MNKHIKKLHEEHIAPAVKAACDPSVRNRQAVAGLTVPATVLSDLADYLTEAAADEMVAAIEALPTKEERDAAKLRRLLDLDEPKLTPLCVAAKFVVGILFDLSDPKEPEAEACPNCDAIPPKPLDFQKEFQGSCPMCHESGTLELSIKELAALVAKDTGHTVRVERVNVNTDHVETIYDSDNA